MAIHWIMDITSVIILIPPQEFGGTVMMTIPLKVVVYEKGLILEIVKKTGKKKAMSGSTDVLLFFYTRTSHLTKYGSIFIKNSPTCPKYIT